MPLRDINWLRQGRWVHQAKIDFEKHIVNKIRLQPSGRAPSAASGIAGVMSRLLAEKGASPIAPTNPLPGAGKPLVIHLSHDPFVELRALARSTGREIEALAAELPAAAVADAESCLDEGSVDAMARARRELLVEALPERQPGVRLHDGA